MTVSGRTISLFLLTKFGCVATLIKCSDEALLIKLSFVFSKETNEGNAISAL